MKNLVSVIFLMIILSSALCAQMDQSQLHELERFPFHENTNIVFICDPVTGREDHGNAFFNRIRSHINKTSKATVTKTVLDPENPPYMVEKFNEVLTNNPTIAVVFIGMSDIMRTKEDAELHEKVVAYYERSVSFMLEKLSEQNVLTILVTPTIIGEKRGGANKADALLDATSAKAKEIGTKTNIPVVDMRTLFMNHIEQHNHSDNEYGIWSSNENTLNDNGNLYLACEISRSLNKLLANNPGYLLYSLTNSANNLSYYDKTEVNIYPMDTRYKDNIIHYTTAQSRNVTENSPILDEPIPISRELTFTAAIYLGQAKIGVNTSKHFTKALPLPPAEMPKGVKLAQKGLKYTVYNPISLNKMPNGYIFPEDKKKTGGITKIVTNNISGETENYAMDFEGYIEIKEQGFYSFATTSDDGSILLINDKLVVDNDGSHGNATVSGSALLGVGFHKIRIMFFQGGGGHSLSIEWKSPNDKDFVPVPEGVFYLAE